MTLLRRLSPLVSVLAACGGCGDDGNGSADAAPPDPCAPEMTFTGELLDWDSGGSVGFMGVPGATVVIPTDTTKQDITAPNGRWELCVEAKNDEAEMFPAPSTNYIAGRIVIWKNIQVGLPALSLRTFTTTRAADFGFDATQSHVFVHVLGGTRTVSMSSAFTPQTMQTFANGAWSAGNTGTDLYFGNIPASGSASIVVSGGDWTGPTSFVTAPGEFTFVTIRADQ
jgi:hypothetical protein